MPDTPAPAPSTHTLSEAASKALLAEHGIPVLGERIVATAADAAAAATELGYPVVAKLCGDRIAHKTERGLVRLNLPRRGRRRGGGHRPARRGHARRRRRGGAGGSHGVRHP